MGWGLFPNVVKIKAGFGVGGETGDGVLRVGGRSVAYYNTSGASIGLQIGAQSYSQVLMFLTDDALARFRDNAGWQASVDGSVAVLKTGTGRQIDTAHLRSGGRLRVRPAGPDGGRHDRGFEVHQARSLSRDPSGSCWSP